MKDTPEFLWVLLVKTINAQLQRFVYEDIYHRIIYITTVKEKSNNRGMTKAITSKPLPNYFPKNNNAFKRYIKVTMNYGKR